MSATTTAPAKPRRKAVLWLAIGLGLLLIVAANGHLVYVAMSTQPDCVDHLRTGDVSTDSDRTQFRAAKSACSPR